NILFKVVIDSNPAVGMRCFADSEANITANVRSACNAVGGNFDENTFLCALPSKSFGNKKITDLGTEGKDEGLSFQQIEQQILPNLLDPNFLEKEGDTAEEKLTIQGKLLLTGDPSSAKDAVTLGYIDNLLSCPAGKVGVFVASAGKVVCSDLLCSKPGDSAATQAYFVGIDKNGNASCNPLVKSG